MSQSWIETLFPHTGAPDRLAHRLQRLAAKEIDVRGKIGGVVTVALILPGLDGRDETVQANIFLPPVLRENPKQAVALVHNAGYELDAGGAEHLLAKGNIVSTPHAHPLNPLGRGTNVDNAILHALRQLPFVDAARVGIQGGSAGGWMTLMLTADTFPLVYSLPDVPPIHWGYNAAYIGENQVFAAAPAGSDKPRMPVLQLVAGIADQSKALYGVPFDHPAFLAMSPLAHTETITAPTLVTCSTADILVPIDQVGAELAQPREKGLFPDGYWTAVTSRFPGIKGRRTLLSVLPKSQVTLFRQPLPPTLPRVFQGGTLPPGTRPLVLPFSKTTTWSVVAIDEGPVIPTSGHFKYVWGMDHEPFRQWAEGQGVQAAQLTRPKLERLMKRLRGEPWRPLGIAKGNVLDYPEAERADVLVGLRAFARDDTRALHLADLYAQLPRKLKQLGPKLGKGDAESIRAALR